MGITQEEGRATLLEVSMSSRRSGRSENKPQVNRLDFVSALVDRAATRDMQPLEYLERCCC